MKVLVEEVPFSVNRKTVPDLFEASFFLSGSDTLTTWQNPVDQAFTYSHAEPCNGTIRWYDPITGRWLSNDPIGISGGLNQYVFCNNNPVNFRDPFGLDYLLFDGSAVYHFGDDSSLLGYYPSTSGQPGSTDTSARDLGPIPEGSYTLNPSEITPGGYKRSLTGDWGAFRAPLHPNDWTDTFGRSGFFLHGGKKPGSKGCIDVGEQDRNLFPILQKHNGPIDVFIDYPDSGPPKWWENISK